MPSFGFLYTFCKECNRKLKIRTERVKKHSGKCRPCSASNNLKKARAKLNPRKLAPYRSIYNKFVSAARRGNKELDITFEDFLEYTKIDKCGYCEEPIKWEPYIPENRYARYNLDRMINTKGYTKDNVIVCCWHCNQAKSDLFTHDEFKLIVPAIKQVLAARVNS